MIPLKLHVKNFLSYGPQGQTIDFGPYNLICLNGKNGHGKSALLDAITWALWGQARKIASTAKPDSQLLRLGQTHMMVIFDFMFNGQTYRIKREYSETHGKPYAVLDFAIIETSNDNKARPLTDKTIRATQHKIETMLGLDFDSFINSAFLRQGQSNEFSKKSPKERKDVLATILSLQQYEALRKIALDKAKQATTDSTHINQLQQRITNELAAAQTIIPQLADVDRELAALEKHNSACKKTLDDLAILRKQYQEYEHQEALLAFKKNQIITEQSTKEEQVRVLFNEWRLINRKKTTTDVHSLHAEKQLLSKSIDHHQQTLQKTLELKEEYLLKKELEQQRLKFINDEYQIDIQKKQRCIERLEIEKSVVINACKELEQQKIALIAHHNDTKKSVHDHEQHIAELTTLLQKNNTLEQRFEKEKTYYHHWVAQANLIKTEYENLEYKKQLAQDINNPSCSLCEQNLSASRKRFLQAKFSKLELSYQHKRSRLTKVLTALKQQLVANHALLEQHRANTQKHNTLQTKHADLLQQIATLNETQKQIEKKYTDAQTTLSQHDMLIKQETEQLNNLKQQAQEAHHHDQTYQLLKQELDSITNALQTTSYKQQEHQQAVKKMAALEQQYQEYSRLQEHISLQQRRKDDIHTLCSALRIVKKERETINHEITVLDEQKKPLSVQLEQEIVTKNQLRTIVQEKESLLQRKGSLEQQRAMILQREQEMHEYQKKYSILQETIDDYQMIATALGKEGIQALLIEDALPEIEQEANALLAQLTNNQAHISIESLRDLKKGGTKETLDIKISDPMGIRPYELFSGGEAFRIDFALRIAISKLLARRAGTSLQTLIIDEGFGSQDEEGIAHIMDCIHKIQDNFAKIIIVSHLTSMKEQFPVHFLIEKGPKGSTITVVEH